MAWFLAVILFACLQSCITLPRRNSEGNFVGEGSNDLATSILKGYEHESSNFVFSPLGYSTILAILAEGAVGKTRQEIVSTLKFPPDTELVRGTFKSVFQRMTDKETLNKPEFRTYFYIYKNITVNDDYRKILSENYLTEIKSVDRPDEEGVVEISYESSTETSESPNGEEYANEEKSKTSTTLYPLLSTEKVHAEPEHEAKPKDKNEAMEAHKEKPVTQTEKTEAEQANMEAERIKLDAQMAEMEAERMKAEKEKMEAGNKGEEKKMKAEKEKAETKEQRITERHRRLAKLIFGISLRRKRSSGSHELMGLSANRIGSKLGRDMQSKMIVFNGLYFRGSFMYPFNKTKTQSNGLFYVSETEKLPADIMEAQGIYLYGAVPDLDAKAIELPYEGDRYSLLILLPNTRGGLSKLVADLSGYSLRNLHRHMLRQPFCVRLPKFDFRAISKPVSILKKSGISSIFSSDADLSALSPDEGLYLNELVQLVTIKVNEDTSTNFLTAGGLGSDGEKDIQVERSNTIQFNQFNVDHPFLFFLRDIQENIIISAGKIANPTEKYRS